MTCFLCERKNHRELSPRIVHNREYALCKPCIGWLDEVALKLSANRARAYLAAHGRIYKRSGNLREQTPSPACRST